MLLQRKNRLLFSEKQAVFSRKTRLLFAENHPVVSSSFLFFLCVYFTNQQHLAMVKKIMKKRKNSVALVIFCPEATKTAILHRFSFASSSMILHWFCTGKNQKKSPSVQNNWGDCENISNYNRIRSHRSKKHHWKFQTRSSPVGSM